MISKEKLEEFKKLYNDEFDEELSDQDALEKAIKFLTIIKTVYKPTIKDDK